MESTLPRLDSAEENLPPYAPPMLAGAPADEGWRRIADLADTSSGQLGAVLQTMALNRGYPDPRTIGAGFALITSSAMAGLFWRAAQGQPIPELAPDRVRWKVLPYANVSAIALEGTPRYVEPERLGQVLHGLLDGLMEAVCAETGFPVRGQWSLLASAVGSWFLGWMPENHRTAIAHVEMLLETDPLLARGKPRVTWLEADGAAKAFTTRKVCCFNYRGKSGGYCASQCPLVPAEERLAYAREQYAGA